MVSKYCCVLLLLLLLYHFSTLHSKSSRCETRLGKVKEVIGHLIIVIKYEINVYIIYKSQLFIYTIIEITIIKIKFLMIELTENVSIIYMISRYR